MRILTKQFVAKLFVIALTLGLAPSVTYILAQDQPSRVVLAEPNKDTSTTVLLFNYSKASPATLTAAEEVIDRIFQQSGIRFLWTDCPALPGSGDAQRCKSDAAPGEIRVRIIERDSANYFPDTLVGFAIPPIWASVYYESALRLAETATDSGANVSVILGCLMAHEIGHLLLRQEAHTVDGIMQPRWGIKQIQQAMMGVLGFTPEQSKLMLRNSRARRTSTGDTRPPLSIHDKLIQQSREQIFGNIVMVRSQNASPE